MSKIQVSKKITGFTLVELLVSISIMGVISAALFMNGRQFTDKLEVSTVAQDLSLAIRDVQSYGSSVRETSNGTGQFNYGYGIDFDITHPTYAILFVDTNGNKIYDGDPNCAVSGDECIQKIPLRSGVVIKSFDCADSSGSHLCSGGGASSQYDVNSDGQVNSTDQQIVFDVVLGINTTCGMKCDVDGNGVVNIGDVQSITNYISGSSLNIKSIHITFVRPNLTATITGVNGSNVLSTWQAGGIRLTSRQGVSKTITVNTLGQISVQ